MAETSLASPARLRQVIAVLSWLALWALLAALGLIVAANLLFFATHAWHVLGHPYPLDYGEGPLLAQVEALRAGTPPWRLYADPAEAPYLVVNYPPVYLLAAALLALPLGDPLLAGRLVSLLATAAAVAALWALTGGGRATGDGRRETGDRRQETGDGRRETGDTRQETGDTRLSSVVGGRWSVVGGRWSVAFRLLVVLSFLALPIVREWAVVMRVDMLGVALGLWGLVIVRRNVGRWAVLWAVPLLLLSLYTKPSLLAAPVAAAAWLLFRDARRGLVLALLLGGGGGLLFAALEAGSGGWFTFHVLTANVNEWQQTLARNFWRDQLAIHGTLVSAAALSALLALARGRRSGVGGQETGDGRRETGDGRRETRRQGDKETRRQGDKETRRQGDGRQGDRRQGEESFLLQPSAFSLQPSAFVLLPIYYTCVGALAAIGVGKVGAYLNYFLEFYAGLVWLAAALTADERPATSGQQQAFAAGRWSLVIGRWVFAPALTLLLVIGALLRYYPSWSETFLKPAGMIEGVNPPRIVFGQRGVWADLRRERAVLQTFERVGAALVRQVGAAGAPIVTDVPGVAAQAGQLSRLQVFEHRQLYDAGALDQRGLLLDMANGNVPLVVLDYLGNWLTPEMIAMITNRYAQNGSRGTYDLYRPIDPGPRFRARLGFPGAAQLTGFFLAPSPGRPAYHAGETVLLTLEWQRQDARGQGSGVGGQELEQTKQEQLELKVASSAFSLQRSAFSVQRSAFSLQPSAFSLQPSAVSVVAQLLDGSGNLLHEVERPLVYGALPIEDWPAGRAVQHMHPIRLPLDLPPQEYRLAVTLRRDGAALAAPREIATIGLERQTGAPLGEQGLYVPAPLLAAWEEFGGYELLGDPLMPAVRFDGFVEQCFTRGCLRLRGARVERVPLGEIVSLGDVGAYSQAANPRLDGDFLQLWQALGGEALLGPPVTGRFARGDTFVQYTRFARLEQPLGDEARLGPLGQEYLRLPEGGYRWGSAD